MKAYELVQDLKDEHWKNIKSKELKLIIKSCAGLYLEASANKSSATPNSTFNVDFEVLNRSNQSIELASIKILPSEKTILKELDLLPNSKQNFKENITIKNVGYSSPYWLTNLGI